MGNRFCISYSYSYNSNSKIQNPVSDLDSPCKVKIQHFTQHWTVNLNRQLYLLTCFRCLALSERTRSWWRPFIFPQTYSSPQAALSWSHSKLRSPYAQHLGVPDRVVVASERPGTSPGLSHWVKQALGQKTFREWNLSPSPTLWITMCIMHLHMKVTWQKQSFWCNRLGLEVIHNSFSHFISCVTCFDCFAFLPMSKYGLGVG